MVQFNFSERTIKAKVVYYGPAQSGKTTNLEQIHRLTDPESANRLISLNTAQDRTLFFDLLPFSLGAVSGYDFKIQLYTVPGQVQYNATRRVVLAGADAVVFVADSQKALHKENVSAFENMKVNLLANRLVPEKVPLVLQYYKPDLSDLQPRPEMDRALNFWGRKAFPAVAARGEGVLETFVAVVQEMLAAIAVKYNLKEKGLDPASVPDVVQQAFAALLKKVPPPSPGETVAAPPRVIVTQAADAERAYPLQATPDGGLVSEELLHRAIRSNVELAEALSGFVEEMNLGLATILSHADLALSYRDEAKRAAGIGTIQKEASRLRQIMRGLASSARARPEAAPAPTPTPTPTPPARPSPPPAPRGETPVGLMAVSPREAPAPAASGLEGLLRESMDAARAILGARGVTVDLRVAPGTALPRCPPPSLRRMATSLLHGIAAVSPPGASIHVRSERKPVLLRSKDGEVKRDFLMVALGHGGILSPEAQQRLLQGTDPGPLGEAYRLVRELGGFLRFAPLPGGSLETRVFLPAA
jgi:signal recognition particle receptor subunit beta